MKFKYVKHDGSTVELNIKYNLDDKRLTLGILKLARDYANIETELNEKIDSIDIIDDELLKYIKAEELLVDTLTNFKHSVDSVLGDGVIDSIFGEDSLPEIVDYEPLFEQLMPKIAQGINDKNTETKRLLEKYSIDRVSKLE